MAKVASFARDHELTGFEFAGGIPGTVGGAVMMNAGAYGGEMKDVLKGTTVLDQEGNIFYLSNEELNLGYRKSIIGEKDYVVLEAWIALAKGDPKRNRRKDGGFEKPQSVETAARVPKRRKYI